MTLNIYTHPDCEDHAMPGHPERPERLQATMSRLDAAGLLTESRLIEATEASLEMVERVHPAGFVTGIVDAAPSSGLVRIDADTYMSTGSLRASRLATGACVQAVNDVLSGTADKGFCAVRPPGHHAEIATAMGFCLFNNIAVAAETALSHPAVNRVAILDFDVHHCNGTVDIFKDRDEVLVCSSFQENFYPHRYLDFTNPHILNTPLPEGTGSAGFRRQVEADWFPAITAHAPDVIFISAGFDAHRDDPLGGLNLDEADYGWITSCLVQLARDLCEGRIVSTLEGGYDLDALARSVEVHVSALAAS